MSRKSTSAKPLNAVARVRQLIERRIAHAAAGTALPSVRELMTELNVSPVTVSRALNQLQQEGIVVTRPGAGTYVAERRAPAQASDFDWQAIALGASQGTSDLEMLVDDPPARALALSSGYMDVTLQPTSELSHAARRVLREPDAWNRAPLDGLSGLRAWFANRAGSELEARDALIVNGGQAALSTALRAVAASGAPLLVESPTYVGALAAARSVGLRPLPVPVDQHGIRTDLLAEAFKTTNARALYVQPCYSNPTGVSLAPERRAEILALAEQFGAFIIEDDYCRDLAHQGAPPKTLISDDTNGHVIYIGSLTKSVAPSMRVATLIARGAVISRLRAARVVEDFFVPRPLQAIALEFVTSPAFSKHLRALCTTLSARMRVLVSSVEEHLAGARVHVVPQGGFSVWLALPESVPEATLVREARDASILVSPGKHWFPAEPTGPFIRLSVAGVNATDLEQGLRRLGKIVRTLDKAG